MATPATAIMIHIAVSILSVIGCFIVLMLQSRQEGCGETARVTPGHGNAKASSLHRIAADDDNPIQTKPGEK